MIVWMKNLFKDIIYFVYRRRLVKELNRNKIMPSHVGLILDGNRRYAKQQGFKEVSKGHRLGADKIDEVLSWCEDLGIHMITLWALSTENLRRESSEISDLLKIIEVKITEIAEDPRTHQRRMKIKSLGKFDLLPVSTQKVLTEAEYATKDYDNFHLNIAIGYGGRQEIADALRELILSEELKGKTIDEIAARITPEAIGEHLYTVDLPDPELIIRTSGETRLSGFLLWQSAYSEYYFCDAFWPAFREIDFLRAIRSYQQRRRRFGL